MPPVLPVLLTYFDFEQFVNTEVPFRKSFRALFVGNFLSFGRDHALFSVWCYEETKLLRPSEPRKNWIFPKKISRPPSCGGALLSTSDALYLLNTRRENTKADFKSLNSSMSAKICVRPQKQAAYNASKGAVSLLGRSLATEVPSQD